MSKLSSSFPRELVTKTTLLVDGSGGFGRKGEFNPIGGSIQAAQEGHADQVILFGDSHIKPLEIDLKDAQACKDAERGFMGGTELAEALSHTIKKLQNERSREHNHNNRIVYNQIIIVSDGDVADINGTGRVLQDHLANDPLLTVGVIIVNDHDKTGLEHIAATVKTPGGCPIGVVQIPKDGAVSAAIESFTASESVIAPTSGRKPAPGK